MATSTNLEGQNYSYPPTELEWKRIKPHFTKLYYDDGRKLKDVMSILRAQHGFHATSKMYKSRITTWDLRRNLSHHEVVFIIATVERRKAEGKSTVVVLRGRPVDLQKVFRCQRRKRIKTSDALTFYATGRIALNCDLRCITPPPSNVKQPASQAEEHFLFEFRSLLVGLLDTGLCRPSDGGLHFEESAASAKAWRFVGGCCVDIAEGQEADGIVLRRFSALVQYAARTYDLSLWTRIIEAIVLVVLRGYVDTAQRILNDLQYALTQASLSQPPQMKFLTALSQVDPITFS